MADVFGATSTTEDVLSRCQSERQTDSSDRSFGPGSAWKPRDLSLRTAHMSWALRGIWLRLKRRPAQVRKDAAGHGGSFETVELDLSNLRSVRASADKLLAKGGTLRRDHRQCGRNGHAVWSYVGWL